jgi:hypothetical protein
MNGRDFAASVGVGILRGRRKVRAEKGPTTRRTLQLKVAVLGSRT